MRTQDTNADLIGEQTDAGAAGDETLVGSAGADSISGPAGDDTLSGGAGEETLAGSAGGDTISALGDKDGDTLQGSSGDDTLSGSVGGDALTGGPAPDAPARKPLTPKQAAALDGDKSGGAGGSRKRKPKAGEAAGVVHLVMQTSRMMGSEGRSIARHRVATASDAVAQRLIAQELARPASPAEIEAASADVIPAISE